MIVAEEHVPYIDVDGIQREVVNSSGQAIHSTDEGIRNFWRWFGDSKSVDANGRPLVMVHASQSGDIRAFRKSRGGIWFSPVYDTSEADIIASYDTEKKGVVENPNPEELPDVAVGSTFYPSYLSIKNPVTEELASDFYNGNVSINNLQNRGFDGALYVDGVAVAFSPTQIKSAIGNCGRFSKHEPWLIA